MGNIGFPRQHRLPKKYFHFIFIEGIKVNYKFFNAFFLPNRLTYARIGIIIPKNHVKLAVQRNGIRRVVRESFRHHQALLTGLDVIALVRMTSEGLDKKLLKEAIEKLWVILESRSLSKKCSLT